MDIRISNNNFPFQAQFITTIIKNDQAYSPNPNFTSSLLAVVSHTLDPKKLFLTVFKNLQSNLDIKKLLDYYYSSLRVDHRQLN